MQAENILDPEIGKCIDARFGWKQMNLRYEDIGGRFGGPVRG